MATAYIDTLQITDWPSFHRVCRGVFGFPNFYGENMDAWVDCFSDLDQERGLTKFFLQPEEMLLVDVSDVEGFKSRLPEIFDALVDCSASVNMRYCLAGGKPRLALVFVSRLA